MRDERAQMWKLAGRYSALGIELCVCVVFGALGGHFVDQRFACGPIGLFAGLIVGVGAAVVSTMRLLGIPRKNEQ